MERGRSMARNAIIAMERRKGDLIFDKNEVSGASEAGLMEDILY